MAISDSQKIDLLWKKVGFGKTKTPCGPLIKRVEPTVTSLNK